MRLLSHQPTTAHDRLSGGRTAERTEPVATPKKPEQPRSAVKQDAAPWRMPDSYPGREGGRLPERRSWAEIEESERTIAEWPPGPDREWLKKLLEAAKAEAEAAKED